MNKKRPLQIVTLYYVDGESDANSPREKYQRTYRQKTGIIKNVKIRIRSHEAFEKEFSSNQAEQFSEQSPEHEEIVYTEEETESIIQQYEQRQRDIIDIESTNLLESPTYSPRRNSINQVNEKTKHLDTPPKIDKCLPSTSYAREEETMDDSRTIVVADEGMPHLLLESLPPFTQIQSNIYSKKMIAPLEKKAVRCLCNPTKQELMNGVGCDLLCLNRKLRMECPTRCPSGDFCSNKRFKHKIYSHLVSNFIGSEYRWGIFADENIEKDHFIIEFVGEVLNSEAMTIRKELYKKDPNQKKNFCISFSNGFFIDAAFYGNISRFISHSDEPNTEIQEWVVDRQLRLGFFAIQPVGRGDELTCNFNV